MTPRDPQSPAHEVTGPVLFARYAFPPNHHGYCGPVDTAGFLQLGLAGDDRVLRAMARRVVEAYWVGSPRLDRIGVRAIGNSMEDRFRWRSGPRFGSLAEGVLAGGVPHHSFAVFCIYPWVGLLGDDRRAAQALTVLDRCRIRWGRVLAVAGDQVSVEYRPLTWEGRRLGYGPPEVEIAVRAVDGVGLTSALAVGDLVALHWEWICDKITERQARFLKAYTDRHMAIANTARQPAAALG